MYHYFSSGSGAIGWLHSDSEAVFENIDKKHNNSSTNQAVTQQIANR